MKPSRKKALVPIMPMVAMIPFISQAAFASDPAPEHIFYISKNPYDSTIDINQSMSTKITMNGTFNDGAYALISGEGNYIDATVKNSDFVSDTGIPLKLDAEDGSATLSVTNSTFATGDSSRSDDIELMGGEGASLTIAGGSTLDEGASAWAGNGNATISVNDSTVGADISPGYTDDYVLTAQISSSATTGEGTAEVDVNDSTVNGNIAAQAQNDGDAVVNITNKSQVDGYIYAMGQNMQINVDDATLNGNIYTGLLSDDAGADSDSTVTLTETTYRNDIVSQNTDDDVTDNLTININNDTIIGGETLDDPMKITGYSNVDFNVNYVDQSLIDTGKVSYFYVDNGENITVNSSLATGTLAPIRSGSYIYSDVIYQAADDSQQTDTADSGKTYGVTFFTQSDSSQDVASDIQSTQAGLMASDEMIHHVADAISTELENGKVHVGNNLWLHGMYSGNNRKASQTAYSNEIGGFQIGGDSSRELENKDVISGGLAFARLHDNLDLTSANGGNDINGDYYSAYLRWTQHQEVSRRSHLFADAVFTYGDLQYSSNGNDAGIVSGGDYYGHSYLMQSRFGDNIAVSRQTWLTPYLLMGYENVHQDGYNDGYSDVSKGILHSGFYGAGLKVSKAFDLAAAISVTPFLDTGYTGQFANSAHLETDDYSFAGQNLNGGRVGVGAELQAGKHWHTLLSVNTFYGHDVNDDVNALLSVSYHY